MHKNSGVAYLLLAGIIAAGCAEQPAAPPPPSAADALKEFVPVFKYLDYSKTPVPKRVEELTQFIDSLPTAFYKVQSGDLVLVWGVSMSTAPGASQQVLAYEKQAPTEGGAVLLRDGTVKQMTAAEFNAAPKAK